MFLVPATINPLLPRNYTKKISTKIHLLTVIRSFKQIFCLDIQFYYFEDNKWASKLWQCKFNTRDQIRDHYSFRLLAYLQMKLWVNAVDLSVLEIAVGHWPLSTNFSIWPKSIFISQISHTFSMRQ